MPLPSFQDIEREMIARGPQVGAPLDLDGVRRDKIRQVEAILGRPLIVYAVDMANGAKFAQSALEGMITPC